MERWIKFWTIQGMNLFELLKLYKWQGEMHNFHGGHEIPMDIILKSAQFIRSLD